ncbi:hypothetical protein D7322_25225 [Sphingobacterium puteale]|uniref:Uncharacterized protein n=1 Tax=Sphingobacterium puteale TaxID=2420510 RepID=A0A420VRD1_9SPHI|nr:hypothetical protein D7322_25225 [Sphingobacterium puteale]
MGYRYLQYPDAPTEGLRDGYVPVPSGKEAETGSERPDRGDRITGRHPPLPETNSRDRRKTMQKRVIKVSKNPWFS